MLKDYFNVYLDIQAIQYQSIYLYINKILKNPIISLFKYYRMYINLIPIHYMLSNCCDKLMWISLILMQIGFPGWSYDLAGQEQELFVPRSL